MGITSPNIHPLENPKIPVADLEWLLDNGWVVGDSFMCIAISEGLKEIIIALRNRGLDWGMGATLCAAITSKKCDRPFVQWLLNDMDCPLRPPQ